jgi:glycosyltransferase involved in cell wall biosynthesis
MRPLVSIGMPVYNGEKTLHRALASVLAQDYYPLEIIISDDGSNDGALSICREMTKDDPRVKIHASHQNRGAIWNFNNVYRLSSGKYFMWAAQDDVRDPKYVSKCIELLEQNKDAILCHSHYADVIESIDQVKCVRNLDAVSTVGGKCQRFIASYRCGIGATAFYGLIRSEALKRTALWENYIGSDIALFNELALYGRFIQVPQILFWYYGRKAVRAPAVHFKFLDPSNKYPRIYFPFVVLAWKHIKIIARTSIPFFEKIYLISFIVGYEFWIIWGKLLYKTAALLFEKKYAVKILYSMGLKHQIPMEQGYEDVRLERLDEK